MAKAKQVSTTRIYLDMTKLLGMMVDITPQFPKAYKYTIGEKLHMLTIELMLLIAEAYSCRDKESRTDTLWRFLAKYQVLQSLVRLAGEREWIQGIGRHAVLIELMDGIAKQAAAWHGSLAKQPAGETREP